jgi:hypothetical protein
MAITSANQNRKQSLFPGTDVVQSGSSLGIFSSGVNYQITYDNFIAGLGVTGTIIQDGDPTGAPVLDTQGTVNNIRNLESGSGVNALVSAMNGITIEHNFQSGGGVPILSNITADSPTIQGLVAGTGMSISQSSGLITLTATGATATSDIVIVNSVADFPDPVADVITLEVAATYSLQGLIDISPNRLVIPDGVEVFSENRLTRGLTSSNAGALITANDGGSFVFREVLLSSTGGGCYLDLSGSGSAIFNDAFGIGSGSVSTISSMNNISFRNFSMIDGGSGTYGFLFSGTIGEFNCSNGFNSGWTGVLYDFGTAVFSRGMIMGGGVRMLTDVGNTAISGMAASANIAAGSFGLVYSNKITGGGTALSGIVYSDARWEFTKTQGIDETRSDALQSLSGNVTETVITTTSTPVLAMGTWTCQDSVQFICDAAGRMTYTGEQPQSMPIDFTFSLLLASGGAATVSGVIAINGVAKTETATHVTTSASSLGSGVCIWQHHFTTGDYVELWVENDDNTTDIIVNGVGRVN